MLAGLAITWSGSWLLAGGMLCWGGATLVASAETLKLVDCLGDERMGEGHLRCHPLVNLPLNAFLNTKKEQHWLIITTSREV